MQVQSTSEGPALTGGLLMPSSIERNFYLLQIRGVGLGPVFVMPNTPQEKSELAGSIPTLYHDIRAVALVLEEMVAAGCSRVVLDANSPFAGAVAGLPPALAQRVRLADSDCRELQRVGAVMEPLAEQLGISNLAPTHPWGFWNVPDGAPIEDLRSYRQVHRDLYSLLLGIRHQTSVDIDMARFGAALARLRRLDKYPESRARLAFLQGIATSYAPAKLRGVSIQRSHATPEYLDDMAAVFADAEFSAYSHASWELGVATRFAVAEAKLEKAARRLVRSWSESGVLSLASSFVQAATKVSAPADKMLRSAFDTHYMPVVQQVTARIETAYEAWADSQTDVLAVTLSDDLDVDDYDYE